MNIYYYKSCEWIVTKNMYKVLLLLSVVEVLSTVTHLVLQNEDIYTKVRLSYNLIKISGHQILIHFLQLIKNFQIVVNQIVFFFSQPGLI